MSQSSEEGDGLDAGASGVIAATEGGLKPVAKGRGRAARGGSQTPQQRKQKSRAASAGWGREGGSAHVTAGAACGLARGDVVVASPVEMSASVMAGAVASPAEETPAEMSLAAVYSSLAHKLWKDKDTCPMIIAACSEPLRKFLEKLGTQGAKSDVFGKKSSKVLPHKVCMTGRVVGLPSTSGGGAGGVLRDGTLPDATGSRHSTQPTHPGVGGHRTTVDKLELLMT
jgi:hypothetical protein